MTGDTTSTCREVDLPYLSPSPELQHPGQAEKKRKRAAPGAGKLGAGGRTARVWIIQE